MGERSGIDEALLAAVEETKAKLRRAARAAAAGGDEVAAHDGHDQAEPPDRSEEDS